MWQGRAVGGQIQGRGDIGVGPRRTGRPCWQGRDVAARVREEQGWSCRGDTLRAVLGAVPRVRVQRRLRRCGSGAAFRLHGGS